MRVAEWHVGDGDGVASVLGTNVLRVGHGDGVVGQRRSADEPQSLVTNHELVVNPEALADGQEGLPLALLGALSVAHMESRSVKVADGKSGADGGVHASAEENDSAGFGRKGHC